MVEIVLSIGVVAVALVAIIGILPSGYNVQRENREDTIINQDGNFFLEAIRSGSQSLNGVTSTSYPTSFSDLTNYVESITISNNLRKGTTWMTKKDRLTGHEIVGLLTTPKLDFSSNVDTTNRVTAQVRAISGSAIEKPPGTSDVAFRYLLIVEVVPFFALPFNAALNVDAAEKHRLAALGNNLYELRLTFRWPLLPKGDTGRGRRVFRTLVAGYLLPEADPKLLRDLHFFQPAAFLSPL